MVELQYYSHAHKEWVDAERDGKLIKFANRQEAETYLQDKDEEAFYKGCYKCWEYITCQCCGEQVLLSGFTNTCDKCGTDYNGFGQRLASREQWGCETGESVADVLAVDTEGGGDGQ